MFQFNLMVNEIFLDKAKVIYFAYVPIFVIHTSMFITRNGYISIFAYKSNYINQVMMASSIFYT